MLLGVVPRTATLLPSGDNTIELSVSHIDLFRDRLDKGGRLQWATNVLDVCRSGTDGKKSSAYLIRLRTMRQR